MGSIEDACSCSKHTGGMWGVLYARRERQEGTCFSTMGCGQRHTSQHQDRLSQDSAQATSSSVTLESLPRQSLGFLVRLDLEERLSLYLSELWAIARTSFSCSSAPRHDLLGPAGGVARCLL